MEPREKFEISEFEKFLEKYEVTRISDRLFDRFATLVVAAFGLIAALAWDDAFKNFFSKIFGTESIWDKILYAVLVTLLAVVASLVVSSHFRKHKKKKSAPRFSFFGRKK